MTDTVIPTTSRKIARNSAKINKNAWEEGKFVEGKITPVLCQSLLNQRLSAQTAARKANVEISDIIGL